MAITMPAFASTPLTVLGGDDAAWAFRSTAPDADGKARLQFAYAIPDKAAMRFRELLMAPTYGDVVQSAVCDANLYIFFADGAHYRLSPPPPEQPPSDRDQNDFPELKLPGSAIPLAFCGDDKTRVLGAIVPADAAVFPEEPLFGKVDDMDTNGPPVVEPPSVATTGFALVEYTGNRWRYAAAVPDVFDGQSSCWLAAYDGVYHLVFTSAASPSAASYMSWSASTQSWSKPQQVEGVAAPDLLGLIAHGKSTAVLARRTTDSEDTFTIKTIEFREDEWVEHDPLQLDGQDAQFREDKTAVHRFRDELVVATLDERDGQAVVQIGFWPMSGGSAIHVPREVRALTKLPDLAERQRLNMLLATGVLMGSLLVVFLRRRDSFTKECQLPPGYVLSTMGRRLSAIIVDLLIVSSVAAPTFIGPWFEKQGIPIDDNLWIELDSVIAQNPDAAFWLWLFASALFALYGTVTEATMGATPGKMLLGLKVCNEQGGRPSLLAVIIRNVLRIELYFLLHLAPTAILVVLTRNRQRIGDLIARTTVVEKKPNQQEKTQQDNK